MEQTWDVLFLAGLFPKESEAEIVNLSKGYVQNAANSLQWSIVEGLDENLKNPIKILNSLYIGSFPLRYKKLLIKSYSFSHSDKSEDYNVGFINLSGVKNFFRWISLKPHLKKWALDKKTQKVILAYALTENNMKVFKYIKKLNKDIKTCIIVPDLPQYMNTSNKINRVYKALKSIEIKSINKNIKFSDYFVLLSRHMKEALGIRDKCWVVMEGIATGTKIKTEKIAENQKNYKTILYTGTLNEKYGILVLINAFKRINSNDYRLIICGNGDSKDNVIQATEEDKRIIYKGVLPRQEVLELQKKSAVLVNPRQDNEEFCKYSFPSKLLEYLSSGVPTIAYKLRGIPDEYDNVILYVKNNSEEALANKIIEICEKTDEERIQIGNIAKEFVYKEKNPKAQTRKIVEMIMGEAK